MKNNRTSRKDDEAFVSTLLKRKVRSNSSISLNEGQIGKKRTNTKDSKVKTLFKKPNLSKPRGNLNNNINSENIGITGDNLVSISIYTTSDSTGYS